MKKFSSVAVFVLFSAGFLLSAEQSGICAGNPISITVKEGVVSIHAGERILLRYRYENVPFKPYVQELFSPRGGNILRDAPSDHLHHRGLMFAIKVDGVNFWEEKQTCGRQVHRRLDDMRADTRDRLHLASFTEEIDWISPDGDRLLLKEGRTIEVRRLMQSGVTVLSWQSRFALPAGKKSARLTGSHYHGLGMRFLKSMDNAGRFFNADGKPGEVVRGDEQLVRSAWCAYTAEADGKPVTVAMFDHPQNPRHPATWFTMTKPFAYLSATLNLHTEPLTVASDKPLVLKYAVALWDGHIEAARIDQLYRRWITWSAPGAARASDNK